MPAKRKSRWTLSPARMESWHEMRWTPLSGRMHRYPLPFQVVVVEEFPSQRLAGIATCRLSKVGVTTAGRPRN
ncbi:hypothetical protein Q31a_23790 [Aureliella helgolandensis]|uniref:Uncharacterized protein n=1 Tax=Aureliella helgolandensis TaxID=2527968 RepID=A0A518G646_9BACT|nr:hypothetical protein Q31a_23790 [Aureliella helgolandensis]